jgi:DNA-binding response OmpR family regulator
MAGKILFIEDKPSDIELTVYELRKRFTNEICVCEDAESALDWLTTNVPELIILDIGLPRLDGRVFLSHVREDSHTANVPVVVLTGYEGNRESVLARGADMFLVKPLDVEVLFKRLIEMDTNWTLSRK